MGGILLWLKGAWAAITSPLGLTIMLAVGLAFAGWRIHDTIYDAGAESRQAEIDGLNADIKRMVRESKEAHDKAVADARAVEVAQAKALADIAAKFNQERDDARKDSEKLLADLRAGNVRLRREWQGCEAGAAGRVPAGAGSGPGAHADAELRREGARDLVGGADECDATIRGLQAVILKLQGK